MIIITLQGNERERERETDNQNWTLDLSVLWHPSSFPWPPSSSHLALLPYCMVSSLPHFGASPNSCLFLMQNIYIKAICS